VAIYDVSLTIREGMVVWPGDPAPHIERVRSIERGDHLNLSSLSLGVHTGTHIDAPLHFVHKGSSVEEIPLETLVGPAHVVYLPHTPLISIKDLQPVFPTGCQRLILHTRNSDERILRGSSFCQDFVALSPEAARWLVEQGVRLIGIDALSIASYGAGELTHYTLLSNGVIIIEGLDLYQVPAGQYTLYCLPLKIAQVEGAPARVLLVKPEE